MEALPEAVYRLSSHTFFLEGLILKQVAFQIFLISADNLTAADKKWWNFYLTVIEGIIVFNITKAL